MPINCTIILKLDLTCQYETGIEKGKYFIKQRIHTK